MRRTLLVLFLIFAGAAHAYGPGEQLSDPSQEERARDLFRELRCMVCQNQSIDDSDAPLAKDLRILVRERISAGESNRDIKDFLVARYGDFVLLKPRLGMETIILWGAPLAVLLAGLAVLLVARRRTPSAPERGLSAEERRKLEAALKEEG